MNDRTDIHDVIVVGAGPAGLTAALYLGRFRRRCLVLEDGHSRARWIPTSHNIPGFTAGIGGQQFLATMREQALKYGAEIQHCHVLGLSIVDEGFALSTATATLHARYVLIATGVRDHLPQIKGAPEAVMRSLLRFCPICDAFEAIDKRVAVIGDGGVGEREAQFLTHYSKQVTLLHLGSPNEVASAQELKSRGIELQSIRLSDLDIRQDRLSVISATSRRDFDVAYLALGCSAQHQLARSVQARCDEHGALTVNAHQETSVPGLYAAGDVVRGLNQVVVAAAESAIAATDIHNKLRGAAQRGPA